MTDLTDPDLFQSSQESTTSLNLKLSKGKTVNLNQIINATVSNPIFIQQLCTNVTTAVTAKLDAVVTTAVQEAIRPLLEQIQAQAKEIKHINTQNTKLKKENMYLREKVDELDTGLEELEQYGRRNSLRFHNVPLSPSQLQITDSVIVNLAREKLDINISEDDINRSHIIGRINKYGKAQLICRFRNWKIKNQLYQAKSRLARNPDKTFITEDLTKVRQGMIAHLDQLRKDGHVNSFWTMDGRVFAKVTAESGKVQIFNHDDIDDLDPTFETNDLDSTLDSTPERY